MIQNDLLLKTLAGDTVERPPVWMMRQAGRILPNYRKIRAKAGSFKNLVTQPDWIAEATVEPVDVLGVDAAIIFSDILVIPEAMGLDYEIIEKKGPLFNDKIRSQSDIDQLLEGDVIPSKLPYVFESIKRTKTILNDRVPLIGFAGAPWTVATYLIEGGTSRDHMRTRQWAYRDPVGFQGIMDILVETTIEYIAAQIEAGADAYQLFDSWAGALTATGMERWSLAPCAAIATALRERYPDVPCIMFPRATGPMLTRFAASGNFAGIGIDSAVSPAWAAEALQSHAVVQGNLDSAILIAGGAAMREGVAEIQGNLGGRGRHIFNLGHGVTPETPPDHVAELVALVRGEA